MTLLDPATEAAVGWLSATAIAAEQGLIPPAVVRDVAHALADVARHALLDDLTAQLDLLDGPTTEDLEEIDAEADVIAAELSVVSAECKFLADPSVASRRHLRRAQAALARAVLAHLNRNPIGATQ